MQSGSEIAKPGLLTGAELVEMSAAVTAKFDLPEPEFEFTIGLAAGHLDLLEGCFSSQGRPDLLLEAAREKGRVLLHGEGGAGKSTVARRLMSVVTGKGGFAALVDLRAWTPAILDAWEEVKGDSAARADLLLMHLGDPVFSEEDLAALPPDRRALIVLDGLNETPGPTAASILEVADGIAVRNPQAGILVTDRLLRRPLPSRHWQLAGVVDVAVPEGHPLPGPQFMRGNAFFLSLAISKEIDSGPGISVLDEYLARHVQLDASELESAATAAAKAYLDASSRVFPLSPFEQEAGAEAVEKLEQSGLLLREREMAIFRHHLFHDDLAGRWLAADGERWTAANFESLTFKANSFDVLALALARIGDPDSADRFVLSVYDYNYYGTAYALAEGTRLGEIAVGDDTRLAIVSMLAERRFDPIRPTVAQVEDALRLFGDEVATQLRLAASLRDLLALVAAVDVEDPHIRSWQELFVSPVSSPARDEAVEALLGADPLLGWTAANVLRRTELDDSQLEMIWAALADDGRWVVRWRAAHALGNQPEPESVSRLMTATRDPHELVRYGAVRSVVDLAATSEELRADILRSLEMEAERLVGDPKPALELERSLQRVENPAGWITAITPLVEALWAKAPTIERREHWRVVARRIWKPGPADSVF